MHRLAHPLAWSLLSCLIVASAAARPRERATPAPAPPQPTWTTPLWPDVLPFTAPLEVPDGLASLSATTCRACHTELADGWSHGAHGQPPSEALRAAATAAGDPACLGCHLPLARQHPDATGGWSPSLAAEGVTCASCHVREGVIVGARPADPAGDALRPHPVAWTPTLRAAEGCASCHQHAPGGGEPLYDTVGEWRATPWAAADVGCVDCHMGPGAAAGAATVAHGVRADLRRALTLELDLDAATLKPGATTSGRLRVRNTGAGHHVPSGSPFKGLRLRAVLTRDDGPRLAGNEVHFARQLGADGPPWVTVADTRLAAGAGVELPLAWSLPADARPGAWRIEIEAVTTRAGADAGTPEVLASLLVEVR